MYLPPNVLAFGRERIWRILDHSKLVGAFASCNGVLGVQTGDAQEPSAALQCD